MTRVMHSDEARKLAIDLKRAGASHMVAARVLHERHQDEFASVDIAWNFVRDNTNRSPDFIQQTKGNIVMEDKKECTESDIAELSERMKDLARAYIRAETKQTQATFTLKEEKPVLLCFWGDHHRGHKGVDYDTLDRDTSVIASTDGIYWIGTGDYIDNDLGAIHGSNSDLIPPDVQLKVATHDLMQCNHNCIAIVRGCHEEWANKLVGADYMAQLAKDLNCVNLWHGGTVTLNFGDETFVSEVRHKMPNESNLNTTNAQRNCINRVGFRNMVACGHKHTLDFQILERMDGVVAYIRAGGYKVYDDFGQKLAGYKGHSAPASLLLFPDRREPTFFYDFMTGVETLKKWRG